VNATFKRIDAAAYVFTRGDAKPAFVLSIGGSF
jgi:hypothetical protein